MTEQSRYRLTGAIFLAAMVLLLAPMLFDGDGLPAVAVQGLSPAEPMQPVQAPASAFDEEKFTKLTNDSQALRERVDDDGFATTSGTRLGDVALSEPTPEQVADPANAANSSPSAMASEIVVWAVQVASFRGADNAEALRDRLRSAGYEGFLSTMKQAGEVWTRVIVGPFLDKTEAQRVATAVSTEFAVDAQLRTVAQ